MPFALLNLILLLLSLLIYGYFRSGVLAYCKLRKMSKSHFKKNTKGAGNFWLYSLLGKKGELGALYYLNLVYLFLLAAFFSFFALSWVEILKVPTAAVGIILSAAAIPTSLAALIYNNKEDFGKAFVLFRRARGYNGRKNRLATAADWLFAFVPMAVYLFFLTR